MTNMATNSTTGGAAGGGATSSYRITASLKRQKSTGTHPSGQHSVTRQTEQLHDVNSQHHCEITQKPGELKTCINFWPIDMA